MSFQMNISKFPEIFVVVRINVKRSMTAAVLSSANSGNSLTLIRVKICFWSLLLLVFLMESSALHRDNGTDPRGYFRGFSKSLVFPCFTEIDNSFAKMSRLTSTVFVLITSFFTAESKFFTLSRLMGSLKRVLVLGSLSSTKSLCLCFAKSGDEKRKSFASLLHWNFAFLCSLYSTFSLYETGLWKQLQCLLIPISIEST